MEKIIPNEMLVHTRLTESIDASNWAYALSYAQVLPISDMIGSTGGNRLCASVALHLSLTG